MAATGVGAIRDLLTAGTARLAAAGIPDAARDARLLLAGALDLPPDRLTLILGDPPPREAIGRFDAFLEDRVRRRPVSQILGRRAFWGRDFTVTSDVLDPRPETETLIALALDGPPGGRVLDLGTGSGAILVTLLAEWPAATGIGTDASVAALRVAAANAARHGVAPRAEFRNTDWAAGISGPFDVIVSNPPYIPSDEIRDLGPEVRDWEPGQALTAGPTGLEAYRRLAADLPALLAPQGRAYFEFGAGQGPHVAALFASAGFGTLDFGIDLDGRERVLRVERAQ